MSGMVRWTPRLLVILALGHLAYAFVSESQWSGIFGDGFVGAASDRDSGDSFERVYNVWFAAAGVALLALATLTWEFVRATGRVPTQVGWFVIGTGILLCAVEFPNTGAWAMLPIGLFAVMAARKPAKPAPVEKRHESAPATVRR